MGKHRIARVLLVGIALLFLSGKNTCEGEYVGLATPAQPYGQLVDRLWDFLDSDVGDFPPMVCPPAPGEPPYFYSFAITSENDLFPVSYPAFTASVGIRSFLAYHLYSGNEEAIARATHFADFVLSGLTPEEDQDGAWVYGGLPYSTLVFGCFGLVPPDPPPDGPSIELDKAAMFASALLELHDVTDDVAYLDAAIDIGDRLLATQRLDGSWPFRVIPESGEVYRDYTSNQIAFHRLMAELEERLGGGAYGAAADASWEWILDNPVRTLDWNGFYEDVDDAESKTNFAALETLREFVRRAPEDTIYPNLAWLLWSWVEREFLITEEPFSPLVPVIWEQTGFVLESEAGDVRAGTASSTIQWALAAAELGTLLGDAELLQKAVHAANVITSVQQPDGRLYTIPADANGGERLYPLDWYEQEMIPMGMMLELMALLPGLAPADENHVLQSTSTVQTISYSESSISYSTRAGGFEQMRLIAEPTEVRSDGVLLAEVPDLSLVPEGYTWDGASQLLTVRHQGTDQIITMPGS